MIPWCGKNQPLGVAKTSRLVWQKPMRWCPCLFVSPPRWCGKNQPLGVAKTSRLVWQKPVAWCGKNQGFNFEFLFPEASAHRQAQHHCPQHGRPPSPTPEARSLVSRLRRGRRLTAEGEGASCDGHLLAPRCTQSGVSSRRRTYPHASRLGGTRRPRRRSQERGRHPVVEACPR